jgi:hypothetical protein
VISRALAALRAAPLEGKKEQETCRTGGKKDGLPLKRRKSSKISHSLRPLNSPTSATKKAVLSPEDRIGKPEEEEEGAERVSMAATRTQKKLVMRRIARKTWMSNYLYELN